MRVFIALVIGLSLFACNRKADKQLVQIKKTVVTAVRKSNAVKPKEAELQYFPIDTIYPGKILTAGLFHSDEVDSTAIKHSWMGVFKADSSYYLNRAEVKIYRAFDGLLDSAGQKTGWMVKPVSKDSSILLISGINYLKNRTIKAIQFKKNYILPGKQETFLYNGNSYTLYATGINNPQPSQDEYYNVSHYRLFIKAVINGQTYNQMIVSIESFNDNMVTILFTGDIDGDGRPDLIIDTSNHYNSEQPTLYLSKPATPGNLLKVAGMHTSVGC